jgi:hypothetical protein
LLQVNGIILENGADRDVAAVSSAVAELQFEDEDDEAYCNKVRLACNKLRNLLHDNVMLVTKLAHCTLFLL